MSGGSAKKPNRVMYSSSRFWPSRWPIWAKTVFTEFVRASVRVIGPKLSVPALHSGRPWTVMQWPLASMIESGVRRCVSRAAAAVTVLNVEPGA